MGFGGLLRSLRRSREMTLEQLAARSGVDPSTLSLVECGRRLPPELPTVVDLADALGLDSESWEYQEFVTEAGRERAQRGRRRRRMIPLAPDGTLRPYQPGPAVATPLPSSAETQSTQALGFSLTEALMALLQLEHSAGIAQVRVRSRAGDEFTFEIRERS